MTMPSIDGEPWLPESWFQDYWRDFEAGDYHAMARQYMAWRAEMHAWRGYISERETVRSLAIWMAATLQVAAQMTNKAKPYVDFIAIEAAARGVLDRN